MPDGSKRARRNGKRGEARRTWYAHYRAVRFAKRYKGNTMTIYKASNGRCVGANVSEEEFAILVLTLPNGVYEVWQGESYLGHVTVKHCPTESMRCGREGPF